VRLALEPLATLLKHVLSNCDFLHAIKNVMLKNTLVTLKRGAVIKNV